MAKHPDASAIHTPLDLWSGARIIQANPHLVYASSSGWPLLFIEEAQIEILANPTRP